MALAVGARARGVFIDWVAVRLDEWADHRAMETAFVHRDAGDAGSRAWRGVSDDEFANDVYRCCGRTPWRGFAFRPFGAFHLRDCSCDGRAIRAHADGLGALRPGGRRER